MESLYPSLTKQSMLATSDPLLPIISPRKLYSLPVLLSGVGPLLLLQSEEDALTQHYKETLQGLQKLYQLTPRPVVCFLFSAFLHIKQLGLFGMMVRQPENNLTILQSICLPPQQNLHGPGS